MIKRTFWYNFFFQNKILEVGGGLGGGGGFGDGGGCG